MNAQNTYEIHLDAMISVCFSIRLMNAIQFEEIAQRCKHFFLFQ